MNVFGYLCFISFHCFLWKFWIEFHCPLLSDKKIHSLLLAPQLRFVKNNMRRLGWTIDRGHSGRPKWVLVDERATHGRDRQLVREWVDEVGRDSRAGSIR